MLEDDAVLRRNYVARLYAALAMLPERWDLLYLGYNTLGATRTTFECERPALMACGCEPVCRVRGPVLDMLGYAVHRDAVPRLIRVLSERLRSNAKLLPVDVELALHIAATPELRVYAVAPNPVLTQTRDQASSDVQAAPRTRRRPWARATVGVPSQVGVVCNRPSRLASTLERCELESSPDVSRHASKAHFCRSMRTSHCHEP